MTLKECSNRACGISLELHGIIAGIGVLYDALDDRKEETCAAALMGFISALKRQENELDQLADDALT